MNFQIDNGQLMLKAYGQQILIETKLFNGEKTLDFIVQKLEQQENEWIIHWVLPNEVIVIQTCKKNERQPVLAYQLQLQAQKTLVGIVQQTYGIQNAKMPYYMIPGYLYGTNNPASSKGMQPKFAYRKQENYPQTPVLFTRADRSTHNAVLVVTEKSVLGIRIDERSNAKTAYYNGLGIDTRESDVYDRIAITLGYTHLPVWYRGKLKAAAVQPTPTHGYLQLAQGEKLEVSGHLYFDRAGSRYDYEKVIENFYYHIHQGPKPWIAQKEGIELLTNALIHDGYNAELHFFPSIVKTDTRLNITGDTAWTGGMQVIYPLAKAIPYNTEAKAVVLDYVDELITKGFNEQTHFFYESKAQNQWQVSGWWAEDLMLFDQNQQKITQAYSAYINGQAVTYILKTIAWLNEIEPSIDTSKWLTVAKEVVDHVIAQQRVDGAFGTYYHADDGSALSYDSFQGAWFFAARVKLSIYKHVSTQLIFIDYLLKMWKCLGCLLIRKMPLMKRGTWHLLPV
ncbi:MAG: hypothetical protein ACRC3A_06220 [Culicoidibacterales bacterium]